MSGATSPLDATLLERLFDASSAAIVVYRVRRAAGGDIDGVTIASVNAAASERLRIPRARLVGRDAFEVFGPSTRRDRVPVLDEVLRSQTARVLVTYVTEADSWLRIQYVPLAEDVVATISSDLGTEHAIGVQRDSQADRAVEREQLHRTLFDSVPVGVVLVDAALGVRAFNAAAHEQLGYTREEFAQLSLLDFVDESPASIQARSERVRHSGHTSFLGRHRTKSGERRDIRVLLRRVRVGGIGKVNRPVMVSSTPCRPRRRACEAYFVS